MSLLPTRRLALVAALLAVAMLAFPLTGAADDLPIGWAVVAVTAVLVAIGLLDGLLGTNPRQLVLERRHPPVIEVGREGTITWVIRSDARRRLRVRVADELAPSLHAAARRFDLVVPGGDSVRTSTRLRPSRRGRFELDVLTVRIEGRLGLGARQRSVPMPTVLRVHPAFPSREEAEIRIRRARILEVGLRSARGLGSGTEFEQLREYGPDDEFRRIDWTATARAGKPIVRTYRAERNQSVIVMLDNGRIMAGKVDGVPRIEHGMDAAMMLTAVATRLGDRCGLVAFDRRVRAVVPPARHHDQVGRVSEALYRLEPELAESDYTGAFAEVVARYRRRAMLVVLTDLNEQAVADSVLPALPLVTRTHLVVVAAVQDPQVLEWASDRPSSPEDAYRQVAAVQALADRRRTTARLRAMGATVVDAAPGRLGVDVTDAYLVAKSTGRL
ncbi:DUF58 domain-containing protein [Dermatobacter hominis]|uniref:DUF58 domain-containing protein n=1 Tax=Dermatobacter hominis TaxID=2884263 RepID=UPI001D10021B|nr:DUF58 domain-containing protein [Dermatobacter hominis]UDY37139.1 DUF58 domain-containing protein [Dermatobacter hominis]